MLTAAEWAAVWRAALERLTPEMRSRVARCRGRQRALALVGALLASDRAQSLLDALLDEILDAAQRAPAAYAVIGATVVAPIHPTTGGHT